MDPGRRSVLRAVTGVGSVALAGCVGPIDSLVGSESDRPDYTRWLAPPDTLVPGTRYRFLSLRPQRLSGNQRITPLFPDLSEPGIARETVERIVAGNGGYGITGEFEQSHVVESLRDRDYEYVGGVGNAWLLAPPQDSGLTYAIEDRHLAIGYQTPTDAARTVAETLIRARHTDPNWTTTDTRIQTITATLGDPPLLTVGFQSPPIQSVPTRATFSGMTAWGIAEHPTDATTTIALVFTDPTSIPSTAIETWATHTFPTPTIDTSDPTITITTTLAQTPSLTLPVPDRSWPMTGATPQHTGTIPGTRPPTPPIGAHWQRSLSVNGRVTHPVADATTIYLGVGDLVALAASDGSTRWRTDATVTNPPAVAGDTVITPTETGVRALNTSDGTERWHRTLPAETITAPSIAGDTVTVGATGADSPGIYSLSLSDGTTHWTSLQTDIDLPPAVGDDTIYAVDTDTHLHAITPTTGTRTQHWSLPGLNPTAPVIGPTHVYIATATAIHAYTHTTGDHDWTIHFDTPLRAPPALIEDRLIVGESRPGDSDPGSLSALATTDGHRHWTRPLDRAVVGQPAIAGTTIHVAGAAGSIDAFDLTDGSHQWRYRLPGTIRQPIITDDQLIITTLDGRIASLGPDWLPGPHP